MLPPLPLAGFFSPNSTSSSAGSATLQGESATVKKRKLGRRIWEKVGYIVSGKNPPFSRFRTRSQTTETKRKFFSGLIEWAYPGSSISSPLTSYGTQISVRGVEHLEDRTVPAVVTWDGGAGSFNWGDLANWDQDQLPTSGDSVVIPDLAGDPTILLNVSATVKSITSAEGFKIDNQSLTLTEGASLISGPFTLQGAELDLNGAGKALSFAASSTVAINSSNIAAYNGASLFLPGLTAATNARFHTQDPDTLIDLPNLANLTKDSNVSGDVALESYGGSIKVPVLAAIIRSNSSFYGGYLTVSGTGSVNAPLLADLTGIQFLTANQGGKVSLPSVTSWSTPSYGTYYHQIVADDAGSEVNFPNLTSLVNANAYGYELGLYARSGGAVKMPQLTSLSKTNSYDAINLYVQSGGTLQTPLLMTGDGISYYLDGAASSIDLSHLSSAKQASFNVSGNASLALSALSSLDNTSLTISSASVDLTSITSAVSSTLYLSGDSKVQLPGLSSATNLYLHTEGAGSVLDLPNLTSLIKDGNLPNNVVIEALNGTIKIPALKSITNTNSSFYGGNIEVQTTGALEAPLLSDITGVEFLRATYGGKLSLPAVTAWTTPNFNSYYTQLISEGAGAKLDLPNLATITDANPIGYDFSIYARNGGAVNLPKLTALTKINNVPINVTVETGGSFNAPLLTSANGIIFTLSGASSSVDISKVASADSAGFNLLDGAKLNLPLLASVTGTAFSSDIGGNLGLPALSSVNNSMISVSGGVLSLPLLVAADFSTFNATRGGKIQFSGLTGATNLRVHAENAGSLIDLPSLTALMRDSAAPNDLVIEAFDGSVKLAALTTVERTNNSFYGASIGVQGTGSIDAPLLADFGGIQYLRASLAGKISLPGVTSLTTPNFSTYQIQIIADDLNSQVELPNLASLVYSNTSGYELGIYARHTGTILLPKLTSLVRASAGPLAVYLESGGSIQAPLLDTATQVTFNLRGANGVFNAPKLATLDQSTLQTYDGFQFVSPIHSANSSILNAYSGSKIQLPSLIDATNLVLRSESKGTLIDLPNLTMLAQDTSLTGGSSLEAVNGSINLPSLTSFSRVNNSFYGTSMTVQGTGSIGVPLLSDLEGIQYVRAFQGGKLSFPGVTAWSTPAHDSYEIDLIADDLGSLIQFPNLLSIEYNNPLTYLFNIYARAGGTIDLPQATSLIEAGKGAFNIRIESGGSLLLPSLVSASSISFDFSSPTGTANLAKLASADDATFNTSLGFSLSLPGLTSAINATFNAYTGSQILGGLVDGTNIHLHSENSGSKISLPNLLSLKRDANQAGELFIEAQGGLVDLPALTAITRVSTSFHAGDLRVSDSGLVNAPLLADITGLDYFETYRGGKISLPGVTTWTTPNFDSYETGIYSNDPGSLIEFPNLQSVVYRDTQSNQFGVYARNGATVSFPELTSLTKAAVGPIVLLIESGGQLDLPKLTDASSLIVTMRGLASSLEMPLVSKTDQSSFALSLGANLILPSLSTVSATSFSLLSGASATLPAVTMATNLSLHAENAGSKISLPDLTTLKQDDFNGEVLGAIDGSIDLPSLVSILRPNNSYFGSDINVFGAGSIHAPLLADISGIDQIQATGGGKISLPAMTAWATPNFDANDTNLYAANPRSQIEFPNLASITHLTTSSNRFSATATDGATMSFPKLTSVVRSSPGEISFTAETTDQFSMPLLSNIGDIHFTFNGGAVNHIILWTGAGGSLNWSDGANWDQNRVPSDNDDVVIPDLPGDQVIVLDTYARIRSLSDMEGLAIAQNQTLTVTSGMSHIMGDFSMDRSALSATTNAQLMIGSASSLFSANLGAYSGGAITISGLTSATNLILHSESAGSSITLPDLTSLHRDPNAPGDTSLEAFYGSISLPSLTEIVRESNSFNAGDIQVRGTGQLLVPQLASISGIDSIQLFEGAHLSLPAVTALSTPNFDSYETVYAANDLGSVLEFPNLASATHADTQGYQLGFYARNGGKIALPALTTVIRSTNAPINLAVESNGRLEAPLLASGEKIDFRFAGLQGSADLSSLATLNQTTLGVSEGFSLSLPALTTATDSTIGAYNGSKLLLPALATANNLHLHSESAGTISLPALTSLKRDPNLQTEVFLEALGGTIDLPVLTSITRIGNSFYGGDIYVQGTGSIHAPLLTDLSGIDYIQTTQGAHLSLPGVTSWTTPNFDSYETRLVSYDCGSSLAFPNLASIGHADTQGYQLALTASGGGKISLPKLTALTRQSSAPIYLNADSGGRLELPLLGAAVTLTLNFTGPNSSVDLTKLANVGQSTINTSDGFSLDLPNLTSASAAIFNAYGGSEIQSTSLITTSNLWLNSNNSGTLISLPNLATIKRDANLANDVQLQTSDGLIDLPALTAITRIGNSFYGGDIYVQGIGSINAPLLATLTGIDSISVSQSGHLSLPGLVTWTTPAVDSYETRMNVTGAGSLIEFPNLITINHSNTNGYGFVITATDLGTLNFPKLTALTKTASAAAIYVQIDYNGKILLPELATANLANFNLRGDSISAALPKLATAKQAVFTTYDGFVLSLPSLISANGSTFNAYRGSAILAPALTSASNLRLHAEQDGSIVAMPSLSSLSRDRNAPDSLIVEATDHGIVNLPGLMSFLDTTRDGSTYMAVSNAGVVHIGGKGTPLQIKNVDLYQDTKGFILFTGGLLGGADLDAGPVTLQGSGTYTGPIFQLKGGLKLDSGADWRIDRDIRLDDGGFLDIASNAVLHLTGSLTGSTTDTNDYRIGGTLKFEGSGSASAPQLFEAQGADNGNAYPLNNQNFYINKLELASGAYVKLQDLVKNSAGNGGDVLYVGSLVVPAGATLDLNGVQLYAKNLLIDGTLLGLSSTKIVSADSAVNTYGATKSFTVLTTGNNGVTKYQLTGSVPSGVKIDSLSGVIDIGAKVPAGTYHFTVAATNTTTPSATQSFTLTVNPAPLTIRGIDETKVYGDALSTHQVDVIGFVNGESIGVLAGLGVTTPATAASPVGTYALSPTGSNPNYAITLIDGTLTITKANLSIQAEDKTKVYGDALPDFTFNIIGLVNGDTVADLAGLGVSTSATALSNVGTYDLTPSGTTSNPNYNVTLLNGVLTITKANQVIAWADPSAIVYGTKLGAPQLNATVTGIAGGTDPGALTYTQPSGSLLDAGTRTLTVMAAETENYFAASNSVSLIVNKGIQTIAWDTPMAIVYGTKLSADQFNATAIGVTGGSAPGALTYGQAIGDLLNAGSKILTVTAAETDNYLAASGSVTLLVNKAAQEIHWMTPAGIVYGTKLSSEQLNAMASGVAGGSAPGALTYGQAIGDLLNAGTQTLSVSAAETENYLGAMANVDLKIAKATQAISWSNPAAIVYGTKLSATQLNATASGVAGGSAPGSLSYDRSVGDLLNAGNYQIKVNAAETDNYLAASEMVGLLVNKAEQSINWSTPTSISYGTKLSATQLNALAVGVEGGSDPGVLTYNRAVGDFLAAGTYPISVMAAETENYLPANQSVNLVVDKAHQKIVWADPAAITYGNKLSANQLGATVSGVEDGTASGAVSYNQAIGDLLNAGKHTLTVMVAGTENYLPETQSVTLLVNKASQTVSWADPDAITYGSELSATQLNATVSGVEGGSPTGALSYNQAVGDLLHAGERTLVVNVAETENYLPETQSVSLLVNKAKQEIAWNQPAPIVYGTKLSATQLSASASGVAGGSAPGTLSYDQGLGSILDAGSQVLSVSAAETDDYLAAMQTVNLVVNKASQIITWANPGTISFGSKLSDAQLNATVSGVPGGSEPGSLSYDRAIGDLLQPGSYTLTVLAAETANYLATTKSVPLLVASGLGITSDNKATFVVGSAGSFSVTTTGFPVPTVTLKSGVLPAGMVLASNGVLSGTPAAGTGKVYAIVLSASNGLGNEVTQDFTLTVNQATAISSANKATFEVGKAGSFTLTATGFPTPTFSLGSGSLPDGITLSSSGLLSGTAKAGTGKNYSVVISATNAIGSAATQSFTLTVNQAPAFTSDNKATFLVGTAGSFTLSASGFPGATFSVKSGSLPSGLTLTANGLLSGTPSAGTGKSYSVTLSAANAIGTAATQDFTLTVNEAPAITSANKASLEVGKAGSFSFTASGFPGATYSLKAGSLPDGVTLTSAGVLSGTPKPGTAKSYALTISVSNGIGSAATQSFTLNVNQAPAITSANKATFEVGKSGSFSFVTSGFPTAVFSIKTGTLPDGLSLSPAGVLSGTPKPGTGKSQTITILATNGIGAPESQDFTLTVNEGPAFTSTAKASFEVGKNGNFSLSTSGFPSATYSLKAGSLPDGLTLSSAGVLSGTPKPGTAKSYTVTLSASNGIGSSASQTFTISVNQAPTITSANKTTFEVSKAGSFTLSAGGFPTAVFSVKTGSLPDGVTLSGAGLLSGTPKPGTGKTYSFTISASNGVGNAVTQDFTLTVNQPALITSAAKTAFEVGKAGGFSFGASGFPGATFSIKSGVLPDGITLGANGMLAGTAKAGSGKAYLITVLATNGVGTAATQDFTLTVNEGPSITSSNQASFEAGKAGSIALMATGFPLPTFTIGAGALPEGVTLSPAGVLSGTPAAGTGKLFTVTVVASNGIGTAASQTFQLTVGSAATITSVDETKFEVGKAGTFTATASGFPTSAFRIVAGSLPAGVTLSGSGVLSGTPQVGSGDSYQFTIGASNGVGTESTQDFTLTVSEKAAFTGMAKTVFEAGKPNAFVFATNGFPNPTFKITAGALPAGVKLSTDGILSGTPAAGTAKAFNFTVSATNGIGTAATQAFTLTVGSATKITSVAKATFQATKSGSFQFTASGFPGATYSVPAGSLPAGLTLSTAGLLSGKAAIGTGNIYTLVVTATNGIGSAVTQNFTLTVNEAPTFTSVNAVTLPAGTKSTFILAAAGVPAPTFSITAGTLPSGVTFDAKTGTLSGTPSLGNAPGTTTLTFKATNSVGASTQTFSLIVLNPTFSFIPVGTLPTLTTAVGVAGGVSVWGAAGKKLGTINPYPSFTGKINTVLADLDGDMVPEIITSPAGGMAPTVKIFDGRLLKEIKSFNAYDAKFTGGVSVAIGDTDGDGNLDIVTSPGKGTAPLVKVFDNNGKIMTSFNAYDASNKNGLSVLVADTDVDGMAEILTVPNSPSKAELRRFDTQGNLLSTIQAFEPSFSGGVSVAVGDIDGDGELEIVATSKAGRATTIRTFAPTGEMLKEWTPIANLTKGGSVVVGDLDGDDKAEIIFAVASGAAPTVKVFDNAGQTLAQVSAYDSKFTGGVSLALSDQNGDGTKELLTAPGKGAAPQVKRFDAKLKLLDSLFAGATTFTGGINLS